ncbi:hypothetical protein MNBD_ALPHA12-2121 [hydrothermal vent metagenome]|uniref:Uncharacterized protein n=1 Tax=hydrothermal vent metagenome TaxID=652676 RepID=A0A3B0UK25_9ZZZZ
MVRFLGWCIVAVAGSVALAMQIGPKEASTNLTRWFSFFGWEEIPPYLQSSSAQTSATIVAVTVFAVALAVLFWPKVWWPRQAKSRHNGIFEQSTDVSTRVSPKLAGLAHAILERAARPDFCIPVPEGDEFISRFEELQGSADPIWTDPTINQMRRDFLQYVGIVGYMRGNNDSARETELMRDELFRKGKALIAALKGETADDQRIPMHEAAQIMFNELQGGRVDAWVREINGSDPVTSMAYYLTTNNDVHLWGVRPPATVMREIPKDKIGEYHFKNRGDEMFQLGSAENSFERVHILKKDMHRRIQEIKDLETGK